MRKILKCILAFALLSMVFTSTVLAEGSISAGDVQGSVTDKDGNAVELTVKELDLDNVTFSKDTTAAQANKAMTFLTGVNEAADNKVAKVGDLDDTTKALIKEVVGTVSDDSTVTPFMDFDATAAGKVSVTINASLLSDATAVDAIYMKDNGTFEKKSAAFTKEGKVEFELSSFSPVAFVIHRGGSGAAAGGSGSSSSSSNNTATTPVVNTAAGDVNHTNYMTYAVVASVVAVGAIIIAGKKFSNK